MYYWRNLTEKQRNEVMEYRRVQGLPKHSPPHFDFENERQYLLSGTCYDHQRIIGKDAARMTAYEKELLEILETFCTHIYAWCILSNHYHVLLRTAEMKTLRKRIGTFNGRTSFLWNGEDDSRGRKVWHNCFERAMRSERHFYASLNYVLNNPVQHGYVERWQDWPWSNAKEYLETTGHERAAEIWRDYPILDYGKTWDID